MKKILRIPQEYLADIQCPRCKGEQEDPCSDPMREFNCILCKGGGKIWMIKPEFYLKDIFDEPKQNEKIK